MDEYVAITAKICEQLGAHTRPSGALAWIAAKAIRVEPMPLRHKLSRDPDDNLFVMTAVAAAAEFLVTQDRDLLALEKPFGVAVITPVQLVRKLDL